MINFLVLIWLAIIATIDLKEKRIPNKYILAGCALWAGILTWKIIAGGQAWMRQLTVGLMQALAGAMICGGILFLLAIVTKQAIGAGDVKLFAVLGLFYGVQNTFEIFAYTLFSMAAAALILMAAKKITRKDTLPMAPFALVGLLLVIITGILE